MTTAASTRAGVITESLEYSTLQSGPEFARWLDERGPASVPVIPDPVVAERIGDTLRIAFNRAQRHNSGVRVAGIEPGPAARGGGP